MTRRKRPDWRDDPRPEEHFVDLSRAELAELGDRLIDDGHSAARAHGLTGWLLRGAPSEDASTQTISNYRAILREIDPPNGRRPAQRQVAGRRRDAGRASLEVIAGGSVVVAACLAAAGHPLAALAALAPITPETTDDGPQIATQGPVLELEVGA